ncbi:MAG: CPBP family glutamic-type intramembrane protease, partial [Gammaproteobacteria bacterium]
MVSTSKLSSWYALWLLVGFIFAELIGNLLVKTLFGGAIHGNELRAWTVLTGGLFAVGWVALFTGSYARSWLREPGADGIAWCAPIKRRAYGSAIAFALILAILVVIVEYLLPPDPNQLSGPIDELAHSHGLPHILFILIAVVLAPLLEEFLFRGLMFAILVRSFNTVTAVVVTTLLFVALHAPDKIHYWPGFLLVG